MKKILAIVHDPGGARALAPVLLALHEDNIFNVVTMAGPFARTVLAEDRMKPMSALTDISMTMASRILENERPDVLLTATSWNSNLEQQFRNAARQQSVPSVVVVDFWNNALLRWKGADYPLEKLTDIICVMDENFKRHMEARGFPKEALHVTGQPHLERLTNLKGPVPAARHETPTTFLFLSQPSDVLQFKTTGGHPLEIFLEALETYARSAGLPCQVTVKAHPKERAEDSRGIVEAFLENSHLRVVLAQDTTSLVDQYRAHDVVAGYYTMGLFEARILGRRVLSLDVAVTDPSVTQALGEYGIGVVDWPAMDSLAGLLRRPSNPFIEDKNQGAARAVVALIKKCPMRDQEHEESIFNR